MRWMALLVRSSMRLRAAGETLTSRFAVRKLLCA